MSERARVRVVSAEIQREGCYLLTQRQPKAVLPDLWEFPGGRVREGETDAAALVRSLLDRLGCNVAVGAQVMQVTHAYEGYDLTLAVYRCTLDAEPRALAVQAVRWVEPDAFAELEFPGADQKTVDALLNESGT